MESVRSPMVDPAPKASDIMSEHKHRTRGAATTHPSRRTHKKCIKCRQWKAKIDILDANGGIIELHGFGPHADNPDGLQVICMSCKSRMSSRARQKNPTARIRHHTQTRCMTQLGDSAPEKFAAQIEGYLGYTIRSLTKHLSKDLKAREGRRRKLRDALNEDYHIDHIRPLSSFKVVDASGQVDWEEFRRCWAKENLRAIPADENLAKGANIAPF